MRILDSSPWRQKTLIVEKHSKRRGNQQNVHTLLRHRRHVAPTLGSPTLLRGRLGKDVEVHVSHSLHSLFFKKIFKKISVRIRRPSSTLSGGGERRLRGWEGTSTRPGSPPKGVGGRGASAGGSPQTRRGWRRKTTEKKPPKKKKP